MRFSGMKIVVLWLLFDAFCYGAIAYVGLQCGFIFALGKMIAIVRM